VHVKGSLGKNERTGIRDTRVLRGIHVRVIITSSPSSTGNISSTSIVEDTRTIDVVTRGNGVFTTERVDGVRKGINSISVVERLGTKGLEKVALAL
jgi:hypothetical protein